MVTIEKIEIKNFRSFGNRKGDTTNLDKLSSLNILSGSNDSGKSNIIRALNLFFNGHKDIDNFFDFQRDFFKKAMSDDENDINEKVVTVKIFFRNEKNHNKNKQYPTKVFLPERFFVSKRWTKASSYSLSDLRSNIETSFKHEKGDIFEHFKDGTTNAIKSTTKASLQKQLTEFLAQIQFHYVPAIKDKQYFSKLYGELQHTLWKTKTSKIDRKKNDFQKEIQSETAKIMQDFQSTLGDMHSNYQPVFQLPSDLVDLFKTLQVQTGNVELSQRGDGVQAKLIPEILHYIALKERSYTSRTVRSDVQSKKYFIWGFEEPENSYEYKNAQILADRFKDIFSQSAQIFITTHSFNFLAMKGDNISKYRVWHNPEVSSSKINRIKPSRENDSEKETLELSDIYKLNDDLGVFTLNEKLLQIYKDIEKVKSELEEKASRIKQHKSYLLVEDKLEQIYKVAWLILNDIPINIDTFDEDFEKNCSFEIHGLGGAGALGGFLRSKNTAIHKDARVVGVFDFDKEGSENFHNLKKDSFWPKEVLGAKESGIYRKRSDHPYFYAMLLPVPNRLNHLADLQHANFSSYIEIENLLPNEFLLQGKFVDEKIIVGVKYQKIKDTAKSKLWKKAAILSKEDFKDFEPLFNTFNQLVSSDEVNKELNLITEENVKKYEDQKNFSLNK